jgi:hypothetical protein
MPSEHGEIRYLEVLSVNQLLCGRELLDVKKWKEEAKLEAIRTFAQDKSGVKSSLQL